MQITNTLGHRLEDFKPLNPKEVKLYTCGPTVYNHVHIGNLRAYIFADIVMRALSFNGYNVNWVMNITDVDDKTIANTIKESGAKAGVEDLKTFTQRYFETFLTDLEKINVNSQGISFVKVTEKIADIQEYIVKLMDKGFAYKTDDGSTYFSIEKYQEKFGDYGALVGPKFLQGKKIGARVKVDEYDKENLSDFALWKAHGDDDGEIFWDHQILGKGRPGWHIECTLINYFKFPNGTDIHTGGVDLIFPHHTNEIAQAQPIYKPFVNYWLHSEHIQVSGEKMAKSLGNVFVLKDLENEKVATGQSLRYLYLQSHYRSKLNVTKKSLAAGKSGLQSLVRQISALNDEAKKEGAQSAKPNEKYIERFSSAINDDLNTANAMALLSELLASNLDAGEKLATAYKMDEVLGLNLENSYIKTFDAKSIKQENPKIAAILEHRNQARTAKNFELSDKLRSEIEAEGYEVIDSPDSTIIAKTSVTK